MSFKFMGKTKLLRTLKMQMNNPNIWFKDVQYYRQEHYNISKRENIVFIDNDTFYEIKHEHYKPEKKAILYYTITKMISPNNFKIEQKIILKESEIE